MLFGKKKNKGMDIKALKSLDKLPVKYVTERDNETFRENKLGNEGAINISETELTVVCGGVNTIRCRLSEVICAELMNLSGITIKGYDLDENREKSVIAYYSDGFVRSSAAKQRK